MFLKIYLLIFPYFITPFGLVEALLPFDKLSTNSFFVYINQWLKNAQITRNTGKQRPLPFLGNAFRPTGEYFTQGERIGFVTNYGKINNLKNNRFCRLGDISLWPTWP